MKENRRCPNCNNSMQNAVPDGTPHLLRCAFCKTVYVNEFTMTKDTPIGTACPNCNESMPCHCTMCYNCGIVDPYWGKKKDMHKCKVKQ